MASTIDLSLLDGVLGRRETASITINYQMAAELGLIEGAINVNKFGYNPEVDVNGGAPADIWSNKGIYQYFPAAAEIQNVVSTDARDNPAGDGADVVTVSGLDANWDMISEDVTLNGTTPVATQNEYIRVFRMVCRTLGSAAVTNSFNRGAITTTGAVSGIVSSHILENFCQTLQCNYSVARGYKLIIYSVKASCGRGKDAAVTFTARPGTDECMQTKWYSRIFQSETARDGGTYVECFPEMSDVRMLTFTENNNSEVSGWWSGFLVRDD